MPQQPWSVVEGSAMAVTGSMLLGWNRARYATMILPLFYGLPDQQRTAAKGFESLAQSLREHPKKIDDAVRNVQWNAPSAQLYKDTIVGYADDTEDKAASPQASADTLNTTADVYDVLGNAVFLVGAAILTAGVINRVAQVNPFLRPAAEVSASIFGRKADQQAGAMAARAKTYMEGGKGLLGKAVGKLMSKKKLLGGAAVVAGGWMGHSAVADNLKSTAIQQTPKGA